MIPPDSPEPSAPAGVRALAREAWRARRAAVAGVVLAVAVAGLEVMAVGALVAVTVALGVPLPPAESARMAAAARVLVGASPGLGSALVLYVVLAVAQALALRGLALSGWRVEQEVALALRLRLYRALAGARWTAVARLRSSDVLQALTHESERVGRAAAALLTLVSQALVAVVYLGLALRLAPAGAAVTVACGALLLAATRPQARAARRAGALLSAAQARMLAAAGEHLHGVKVVKSHGGEARDVARLAAAARDAHDATLRGARAFANSGALFSAGGAALLAGVTFAAVRWVGLPGSVALLLVFLFARLVPRLQSVQAVHQRIVHDLPAYAPLVRAVAELERDAERLGPAGHPASLKDALVLDGVSFAYPGAPGDAVRGVTLRVPAHATVAVVGPSGSGKTTLADIATGLVSPAGGRVVVDGRTLDGTWMPAWRGAIGYVGQDSVLFDDTVRANLLWARPEAAEEDLRAALRSAAADFVDALADGMDTRVGERGVRLSGGERQRIALARALLRRPALLVLDEATSALDAENERRIRDALRSLHGTVTVLLITHRLTSVRDADAVHVMEEGRLVQSGTWSELVSTSGRFRDLWRAQENEAA